MFYSITKTAQNLFMLITGLKNLLIFNHRNALPKEGELCSLSLEVSLRKVSYSIGWLMKPGWVRIELKKSTSIYSLKSTVQLISEPNYNLRLQQSYHTVTLLMLREHQKNSCTRE